MIKLPLIILTSFLTINAIAGGYPFYNSKVHFELTNGEFVEGYISDLELSFEMFPSIKFKTSPHYEAILSKNDSAISKMIFNEVFYYRDTINVFSDIVKMKIAGKNNFVYKRVGTRTKIAKMEIKKFRVLKVYASNVWGGSILTKLKVGDKDWIEEVEIFDEKRLRSVPGACGYIAYFFSPPNDKKDSLILELEQLMLIPYGRWPEKDRRIEHRTKMISIREELRKTHTLVLAFCSS